MQTPLIRPGEVPDRAPVLRVVAFFPNAAQGNLAIQLLGVLGVPAGSLGVTSPDRVEGGQGMVLSIPCSSRELAPRIEATCRELGAEIHRQRP